MSFFKTIVLLLPFLISCGESENVKNYGFRFNKTRKTLGLPLLPENWTVHAEEMNYDKRYNYIIWSCGVNCAPAPYFLSKTIGFHENKPLFESNTYIGREIYTTIDGTSQKELTITYYFPDTDEKKSANVNGWTGMFQDSFTLYNPDLGIISIEAADSILHDWGLKRE